MKTLTRPSVAVVNEQGHNAEQDTGREGKYRNPLAKVKADKRATHTE
jgi:hypothetical protein